MAENLRFQYKFTLDDGRVKEFSLALDPRSLALIPSVRNEWPEWTALSFNQCPNCPLKASETPRCPAAVGLVDVLDFAKDAISYEEAEIEIITNFRTYKKRTALQYGISSIMGVVMAASGCPILDKLRPMTRTHLPFSKMEETVYRMISMYLLAQYLRAKRGQTPDWELKKLGKILEDIQTLNESFWKRITGFHVQDGGVNAVTHLDTFVRFVNYQIEEKDLKDLGISFDSYFKED